MNILINEKWSYQLIKQDDEYLLSVLCGSVGMYEVEVKLTQSEIDDYKVHGKESIDKLVQLVRNSPENYKTRK